MKSMKTNTVQLIIAGIVVVLVAICGTFAWFAVSDSARVNQIGATVVSPSIESGVSEIQIYDPVNGEWNSYNGDIPLSFVPGQSYSFKVIFYAADTQNVWLRMSEITEPENEDGKYLREVLVSRAKAVHEDVGEYHPLQLETDENGKLYADILQNKPANSDFFAKDKQTLICYYDLMLPGTAGNEYFDKTLTADVELIFT